MADPESNSKDKSPWVQSTFIKCRKQIVLLAQTTVMQSETQFLIRIPHCFINKI
jgi:hypothetical protein